MIGKKNNVVWFSLVLLLSTTVASAQTEKQKWVDSVFHTLSQHEKIGQLFFTRFSSHVPGETLRILEKDVASGHIGGVIFTSGTVDRQARMTSRLQSETRIPLLISQDGSGGPGYLLDSAMRFPTPLAQGAIADESLIYRIARETGKQLKALGVHMSLSPNATPVYSATKNPDFLFGDNAEAVAKKTLLHMKGLQDAGVLSCAKYFPLKSIEVIDQKGKSHITVYHDTLVSKPFRHLFQNGLNAVIPDATDLAVFFEPRRSDLKKKLSDTTFGLFESGDLLHAPLGFHGVVMIDVESMESSADKFEPGDAALLAFQAGAEIMIISGGDPDPGLRKIRKLIHSQKEYAARLDARVRKVLALKYDAGLSRPAPVDHALLQYNLHTPESQVLRSRALKGTVTVVKNENDVLPIVALEDRKFFCLMAGDSIRSDIFYRNVRKYVPAGRFLIDDHINQADLSPHDVILVALFPNTTKKTLQNVMGLLQEVSDPQQVVIADFGCRIFQPYAGRFATVINGYTDDKDVVGIIPQVIFGGLPAEGVLPVRYGDFPSGTGVRTRDLDRLAYSFPEDAGIDGKTLEKIAHIANEAIAAGSTPGCYVLVAKEGKVIFDHAFGHLTYDQVLPVTEETIYDLASLTKVSATLQAVMFMQERGIIDVHKKLSVYLPELRGTSKKDVTIIDALTHQAGLVPFVPLWPLTVEGPALKPIYYSSRQNVQYPLQISPNVFGSPILKDSVWSWITFSRMLEKPARTPYTYRYSDLGFMMFKQLAERNLNQPLEDFLQQNFYEPLGAYSLGYNPLHRFPSERIAPTELDTLFRHGLVLGTVHDERAAMLGGVSGHAGLFGTASDLSKLGQMLLQGGRYGGLTYYQPETVQMFTARQYASSRRGLGWDKPVVGEWNSPTSRYASGDTFGHTGFTGTCLWVDPQFDLVYIFLSNRVFPDRSDKLIQTNIRSRIQDVIYEAIFNFCKTYEGANFEGKSFSEQ